MAKGKMVRFDAQHPCPICGGHEGLPRGRGERCHGYQRGNFAHCSREELAGGLPLNPNSETFCHRLKDECACGERHDQHATPRRGKATAKPVEVASYKYCDEEGRFLYQVVKYRPKTFRVRRKVDGRWVYNLDGVPRVLYHLPELLAAPQNTYVFVVEGEKDVLQLMKLGAVATTNFGGAGKWRDEYSGFLTSRHVVILPDNDTPGRKHASQVAWSVYKKAASVRILLLPVAEGGDVSDWIAAGGKYDQLFDLADSTDAWEPAEVADQADLHLTDIGNAERFVRQHGEKTLYCPLWRKWLMWDGKRWARDDRGEVGWLAIETVRAIYGEAKACPDGKKRQELADHAKRTEAYSRLVAMIATARTYLPVVPTEFDPDPWLLNCQNGTVDLQTSELREHRKDDLITNLVSVDYNPEAECPRWVQFLEEIMPDKDVRRFLQRAVGYSLTGDVREQILFFLYGTGANGKSTFITALIKLLDGYAQQSAPDLLMLSRGESHPTGIADLAGARMVASIEVEQGRKMAESLVKQMTGGDELKARRLYEDFWQFTPTFKFWLLANHKPTIRGTDEAIWRRFRLIPFDVVFTGEDQDKQLPERLAEEQEGILAWAVEGCRQWQRDGLAAPEAVKIATEEYRQEMDVLGVWLAECCVEAPDAEVRSTDLYNCYRDWCNDNGHSPMSQTKLSIQLGSRGFVKKPRRDAAYWQGISIRYGE